MSTQKKADFGTDSVGGWLQNWMRGSIERNKTGTTGAAGMMSGKAPKTEKPGAPAKPAKGGRGDVRVNANGIKQTGTGMGKSVPVK